MNIIELDQSEIINIAGGWNIVDTLNFIGGGVGSYLAGVLVAGWPKILVSNGDFLIEVLMYTKALTGRVYLYNASVIFGCVLIGNIVGSVAGGFVVKMSQK